MSVEYFYELKSSFLGYIHRYREDMQPYVQYVQSNMSYVTFQGNSEIWSHKTGGRLIQVYLI